MLKTILSISGRPGLYRLVNRGKGMLIVEELTTGKRVPAYARDKVISLGDISMYTDDGEDVPLYEVLESLKAKTEGKAVDVKAFASDGDVREYFGEILPNYDRDRVYTTDIKKLFSWYNILVGVGLTDFAPVEETDAAEAEAPAAE